MINGILLLSTLIFAIYNTWAHLIRLKIKKHLILLFYFLTYFLMVLRLIDTITTILWPRLDKFDYHNHMANIGVIVRSAAECVLVALGALMVVTMYQLACSVQLVISKIHTVE